MKSRNQRRALPASGDIAAAKVAHDGDAGQLRQHGWIADLHRETARWLMANGLAVAANRTNVFWLDVLLSQEGIHALRGQFYPILLSDCGAGNLVRTAGAQAKQLGAQGVGHRDVMCCNQPDRRGLLDQRYVQAIKAGPGHHTYIERHGLALGRS
ncbi:hypothetical protein D3C80_1460440 [compost metagenome]